MFLYRYNSSCWIDIPTLIHEWKAIQTTATPSLIHARNNEWSPKQQQQQQQRIRQEASCGFTTSKLCCTFWTAPFHSLFSPLILYQIETVLSSFSTVHCTTTIRTAPHPTATGSKINSLLLAASKPGTLLPAHCWHTIHWTAPKRNHLELYRPDFF